MNDEVPRPGNAQLWRIVTDLSRESANRDVRLAEIGRDIAMLRDRLSYDDVQQIQRLLSVARQRGQIDVLTPDQIDEVKLLLRVTSENTARLTELTREVDSLRVWRAAAERGMAERARALATAARATSELRSRIEGQNATLNEMKDDIYRLVAEPHLSETQTMDLQRLHVIWEPLLDVGRRLLGMLQAWEEQTGESREHWKALRLQFKSAPVAILSAILTAAGLLILYHFVGHP